MASEARARRWNSRKELVVLGWLRRVTLNSPGEVSALLKEKLGATLSGPPAFCSSTESIARVRAAPATGVRVTVFERR